MVFEHIEKLKQEYTDKYVIVDATRPELRRFEGQTGVVKTVNMNGNALVEFDANLNIGWFDIAIDYLKVIDAPLPKEEPKKEPAKKKPAAKAEAAKPAAKPGGGMSVADMLAAARGEKGGGGAAPAKPAPKKADAPAKAPAAGGKMSVADMLAAARAEKGGGVAPAADPAPAAEEAPAPEPAEEAPAPEPVAEEAPASEPAAPAGDLPKDVAGMLEYCRKVDG